MVEAYLDCKSTIPLGNTKIRYEPVLIVRDHVLVPKALDCGASCSRL